MDGSPRMGRAAVAGTHWHPGLAGHCASALDCKVSRGRSSHRFCCGLAVITIGPAARTGSCRHHDRCTSEPGQSECRTFNERLQETARVLGLQIQVLNASTGREIDAALATLSGHTTPRLCASGPTPTGRRIAEPLDADAAGQATFYCCFDKIGREEGERDGHIDLPNAAFLASAKLCDRGYTT